MPVIVSAYQASSSVGPVSFPGTLSGSGAPTTVTGTSQLASVPVGNSGTCIVQDFVMTGIVLLQVNINGGGWSSISEGSTFIAVDTQSVQFRINNAASGEALTFNIVDSLTGGLVTSVTLSSI